jgi:hypothetical protein
MIPTELSPNAKAYPMTKKQIKEITNIIIFLVGTKFLFFGLTWAISTRVRPMYVRNMKLVEESVQAVVRA